MSLVRYHNKPLKTLGLNGLFDDFFLRDMNQMKSTSGISVPVNIAETPKAFILEVAAPGRKKELFQIDCEADVLAISWTAAPKEEGSIKEQYKRKEFGTKDFNREFKLPKNIIKKDIQASYKDGILLVEIPKSVDAQKDEKMEIKIA